VSRASPDGTDRVRLAFRYGAEWWNTVITIDLRLWLVKSEANVVAMELVGYAGSLPISRSRCWNGSPKWRGGRTSR
jgi:hypothetical protein